MSGHTARCRARYSSSRSGRTRSRKQTRSIGSGPDRGERQVEQAGDLADLVEVMADAERHVVRRALRAPALEELRRRQAEHDPAVGVADAERLAGHGLALGADELQA